MSAANAPTPPRRPVVLAVGHIRGPLRRAVVVTPTGVLRVAWTEPDSGRKIVRKERAS